MNQNESSELVNSSAVDQPTPAPQLNAEEVEAVIAPKLIANHNETFLS